MVPASSLLKPKRSMAKELEMVTKELKAIKPVPMLTAISQKGKPKVLTSEIWKRFPFLLRDL